MSPTERAQEVDGNLAIVALERRLEATDRLARVEQELAAHAAKFEEREKAEIQAQTERQLAAAAVQTALQDAATTSGKALEAAAKAQAEALTAALKAADTVEVERVGRAEDKTVAVRDKLIDSITQVKDAAGLALTASKEILDRHNELLSQMSAKDSTYATTENLHLMKDAIDSRHVEDLRRTYVDIDAINEKISSGIGVSKGIDAIWGRLIGVAASASAIGVLLFYLIHG